MSKGSHKLWISWRIVSLIVTAIVGLTLELINEDVWHVGPQQHWKIIALIAWLAFATVVSDLRGLWEEIVGPKDEDLRRRCADHIRSLPSSISKLAEPGRAPSDAIGVSVFRVRRPRRRIKGEELYRVVRRRIQSHPGPSALTSWSKEKGVIGKAWKQNKVIAEDLRHVVKTYEGTDEASFDKIPPQFRWGMTFDEWASIVGKYAEVLAVPIHAPNDGPIVGILAVDLPIEVKEGFRTLDREPIKNQVEFTAQALARELA